MVVEKKASELVPGDVFLNNGARVEQVVPCGPGRRSVYLRAIFEDGYTQVATVPAETVVATWIESQG